MGVTSNLVLPPLSTIYAIVTKARLVAYQKGWFSVTALPVPVVSVGNLTTGGTGKTPMVEFVCRMLARDHKKVCVLTRGYGRTNPRSRVVVSDGFKIAADSEVTGDEPLLLAEALKGVAAVVSDADRVAAGRWAVENLGAEVLVLDDGFQHLRLARNLNIVTIDATNPWGGGHLLPRGRLRESPEGLRRADCVVITRADQSKDLVSLRDAIRRFSNARPVFTSVMKVRGTMTVDSGLSTELDSLPQPTAAFAGIGNPRAFFDQLNRAGVDLAFSKAFPNHHRYSQSDLDELIQEAGRLAAQSLVTTAKDAVKLRSLSLEIPCYVLDIEVAIDEKDKFVEMIRAALSR